MTLLEPRPPNAPARRAGDPEALFREARRRERRRRFALVVAALLLAGGAGTLAGVAGGGTRGSSLTAVPALPNAGPAVNVRAFAHEGLLAFASDGALYVLDGATGSLRQVGRSSSGAEEPSFSHDGRWLAYVAAGAEAPVADLGEQAPFAPVSGPLVLADANGSSAHRVGTVGQVSEAVWSPTADLLLVVSGAPYYGGAVWVVSPDGSAWKLLSSHPIYGAVWSPDGRQIAFAVGNGHASATTLETVPVAGGRAALWLRSSGADAQWLVPLGWWKDQGIGVWAGGLGSVPDGEGTIDGAALDLATAPGAPLRPLGRTPPVALVPAASSRTGWLAIDEPWLTTGFGRTPWSAKAIETCGPGAVRCSTVSEAANVAAYDPVWSPDGRTLAFVEAPASNTPSFFKSFVRSWYASGRLFLLEVGSTRPVPVPHTLGATAPAWSASGAGLLYVANDALYLVRRLGATPVRIAAPLLPAKQWTSTYYGGIDWRFQFSWAL